MLEVQHGLYDFERSWREIGRVPAPDELLLCRRPYTRCCEDGDNLACAKGREKAG